MPDFGEFVDKAKDFADEHSDQVQQGLKKAGDFVDQKTGGRFSDQIDQGEHQADNYLGQGGQGGQDGQGDGRQDQGGQDQGNQ